MQAINQVAAAEIAVPKINSMKQPAASTFGGIIIFNPIASTFSVQICLLQSQAKSQRQKTDTDHHPGKRAPVNCRTR